jgi:hypothetical protein
LFCILFLFYSYSSVHSMGIFVCMM